MKVLVTGAGGMLGSDVIRAAEFVNHEVVGFTHGELDIADRSALDQVMLHERPEVVVNCGAYTDVDGAEDDLEGAMAVNAEGAENVAAAANEIGARVIYPSSDYVFDGAKSDPYVESDEPRPQSVYASSKLAGEHETAESNPRHFIARSAWLFGASGRNFVETMLSLARDHGEVVVVRDQVGCPTYTAHLADALVRLAGTEAYGIHHLASQGACSWFEFAQEIFRQAGVECRVMSCTSDEFGRPAPRPSYSVLGTERVDAIYLPHWKEGLASYLSERSVTA
ncbi:MAG TPA: dTDP-4-dehydrorhamnose reductase [Thermoleophilaceae bacterium]|nr:dTDP-4-dehydrorhamnose reductase [Thermoleophilaceae bacterium]